MGDFWCIVGWAIFAYAVFNGMAALTSSPGIDPEKIERLSSAMANVIQMEIDKGFSDRDAQIKDLERRIVELETKK